MKIFSLSLATIFLAISLVASASASASANAISPKEALNLIKYTDSAIDEIMPIIEKSRQVMTDYVNEGITKEKATISIQKAKAEIMSIQSSLNKYENDETMSSYEKNYRKSLNILVDITDKQLKFINKNSLNKASIKNVTVTQTKDLYLFLEKYSQAERELLNKVFFDKEPSKIQQYILWRKDITKIADKHRELSFKTEVILIDFYFSEDISKVKNDIKNIISQTSEIAREYDKCEYNEDLETLHNMLKNGAVENESLVKAIESFIENSDEDNLAKMEKHITNAQELGQEFKTQTKIYINKL